MKLKSHKYISYIKFFLFWVSLIYMGLNIGVSQDIYNLENSSKYADYLLLSKQYNLASEELERLVFMDNDDVAFKVKLLQSYRKSGKLDLSIRRFHEFGDGNIYNSGKGLSVEYLSSLLLVDSLDKIYLFLDKNENLTSKDKAIFKSSSLLLDRKYKEVLTFLNSSPANSLEIPKEIKDFSLDGLDKTFKSPLLAASLSTIIPGMGKIYTRNYVDGIMSLLFIGGTAWQSYKGFDKKGIKSISGWIFGSLSVGFYIGNIYGSVKAAKRYNNRKVNETNKKVYRFIQHYNF